MYHNLAMGDDGDGRIDSDRGLRLPFLRERNEARYNPSQRPSRFSLYVLSLRLSAEVHSVLAPHCLYH
ncbi:hypothetical protein ABIE65_005416 [Constrictibacter sp. MBR-5]|jgi:hypothetical protein